MIESIFEALGAGLSLWRDERATRFLDKLMELKRDWYEESNRPLEQRSASALDHIERELRILASSFAAGVGKPNSVAGS